MLHNVLNSGLLNDTAIPFAIARVATGLFFALSGFHKLFNRARHRTLVNTLKDCGVPCVPAMQWFVPGVELSAGLSRPAHHVFPDGSRQKTRNGRGQAA